MLSSGVKSGSDGTGPNRSHPNFRFKEGFSRQDEEAGMWVIVPAPEY